MPTLTIDFREGFGGDHVVARIDQRVVFDQDGVRTRTQIGHAATTKVELPPGAHEIEVQLPDRQKTATVHLDPAASAFLGVDRTDRGLTLTPSAAPFRYL